ncbi:MAG: NAD(P)/FAD-dependent oxidoreductase [Armatimonadota bacterium]
MDNNPQTLIIGAGPAGIAAAYHLSHHDVPVTVYEMDDTIGGIARTVEYRNFRFDVGGHRFFTRIDRIRELWKKIMGDDFIRRERKSRIFYRGTLIDYPLKISSALKALGIWESLACLGSYFWAQVFPVEEDSFEGWVTNRFGRRLYEHFFKTYTEKAWGMPCTELSADWAAQRIKSLSLWGAIVGALQSSTGTKHTTLIQQFDYPRRGPGMMWEKFREDIENHGSRFVLQHRVTRIHHEGERVTGVSVQTPDGTQEISPEYVLNSMPLKELVGAFDPPPPDEVLQAAQELRYRSFITAGLIIDAAEPFDDQWIYVHEPDVRLARIQNYKSWSPEMVPDPDMTCVGVEYFLWRDEPLWETPDEEIIALAGRELEMLGLVEADAVMDGDVVRMPHAYPVYDPGYTDRVTVIRQWLEKFQNFASIGRNGQHRYNNMDHSMLTGLLAAENILGADHDVWNVNIGEEYLEARQ